MSQLKQTHILLPGIFWPLFWIVISPISNFLMIPYFFPHSNLYSFRSSILSANILHFIFYLFFTHSSFHFFIYLQLFLQFFIFSSDILLFIFYLFFTYSSFLFLSFLYIFIISIFYLSSIFLSFLYPFLSRCSRHKTS